MSTLLCMIYILQNKVFHNWVAWSGMSESGRNKHPAILNHLKSLFNPSLKGTCIRRPLFKCQGQLKLSSRSPLLMFQKREMQFWCWELLHFYFLSLKKICSFPKIVTGLCICHLMLVINLVGKLIYSYFSLFLIQTHQIQRTAQTIFLLWNLLYEILPEVAALVGCGLEASFGLELPQAFVPSIGISPHSSALVSSRLSQLSRIYLGICLPGSSSLVPIFHTSSKAGDCQPQPGLSLERSFQPCPHLTTTQKFLKTLNTGPTPRFWVRSSMLLTSSRVTLDADAVLQGSHFESQCSEFPLRPKGPRCPLALAPLPC